MNKLYQVLALWFACQIHLAASATTSETNALEFSRTALTNLSETSLPTSSPYVSKYYLPTCKTLNTDSCGVLRSSIWKWPACCSSRTNFSSYDDDVGADCSYLDLPYSPSQWTCTSGTEKSCCKDIYCKTFRSSATTAKTSCPSDVPESSCCGLLGDDCEVVKDATTDTCYQKRFTALWCCPKGTNDVITSTGSNITAALIKSGN